MPGGPETWTLPCEARGDGATAWGVLGPLFAWIAVALSMLVAYAGDPADPARVGTARYGHNGEGALSTGILLTAIEIVIATLVLAPWQARPSPGRALVALLLLGPWVLVSGMLCLHAGSVMLVHLAWMVALLAWTLLALASRVVRARRVNGSGAR